jgi:hypothetical protein
MGNNLKLPAPYPDATYGGRVTTLESVSSDTLAAVSSARYRLGVLSDTFKPSTIDSTTTLSLSNLSFSMGQLDPDAVDTRIQSIQTRTYTTNNTHQDLLDRVTTIEMSSNTFQTLFDATLNPGLTTIEAQYSTHNPLQQNNVLSWSDINRRADVLNDTISNISFVRATIGAMYTTDFLSSGMSTLDASTTTSIKDWSTMSQTIFSTNNALGARLNTLESAFNQPLVYIANTTTAKLYTGTDTKGIYTITGNQGDLVVNNTHNNAIIYSTVAGTVTFAEAGTNRSYGLRVTIFNYSTTQLNIPITWDSTPSRTQNSFTHLPLFVNGRITPLPSSTNSTNQATTVAIPSQTSVTFVLVRNALVYNGNVKDGWVYFRN